MEYRYQNITVEKLARVPSGKGSKFTFTETDFSIGESFLLQKFLVCPSASTIFFRPLKKKSSGKVAIRRAGASRKKIKEIDRLPPLGGDLKSPE